MYNTVYIIVGYLDPRKYKARRWNYDDLQYRHYFKHNEEGKTASG